MNISFKKTALVFGLAVSSVFVSCQKDSSIAPVEPVNTPANATDDIIVGIPKKYTLTKYGQANLTYNTDGSLHRVMHGADTRGNTNYRREYSYSPGKISATSYVGGKIALQDTYLIDAKGRCYESKQIDYFLSGVADYNNQHWTSNTWVYEYNVKGQLKTSSVKYHPLERTEYAYDLDGNMTKAITYYTRVKGVEKPLGQAVYELNVTYNPLAPANPTGKIVDQYPIHFSWTHLPNPYMVVLDQGQPIPELYLPIFGKPSKHLITSAIYTDLTDIYYHIGFLFTYKLDADGYVKERTDYNSYNSNVMEVKPYQYKVTELGVNL